jgi:hypothetical protein
VTKPPNTLDQLWDEIPTGPAPVAGLLAAGRAAKRRRRALVGVVAGAVLGGALAIGQHLDFGVGHRDVPIADSSNPSYGVTVRTELKGRRMYYFEGALVEVTLTPEQPGVWSTHSERNPVGWSHTWTGLEQGPYTLQGAVRSCAGNCDSLDPPADSCRESVDLRGDVEVLVSFRYGHPCSVTVSASSDVSDPTSACFTSEQRRVDLDTAGPGRPTPREAIAPFASGSTTIVSQQRGVAEVLESGANGTPKRMFHVTRREDGWWPDSYVECAGESLN